MHPKKLSGPDGFNPTFFQTYRSIVADDVVQVCRVLFNTGVIPTWLNQTLVCLIYKVKQPHTMVDLGLISLCNILMRIVSK